MTKDNKFKWVYSFLMLVVVLAWGAGNIYAVYRAIDLKSSVDILASAGASAITGALIAWNGNIVQYWFRKRPGDSDVPLPPAGTLGGNP